MADNEALHEAVKRADLGTIRKLLAQGVSANGLDAAGMPPVAYVLDHNLAIGFSLSGETREMIRLLKTAGADFSLKGARAQVLSLASSMVTSAAEMGDLGTLEQLLA